MIKIINFGIIFKLFLFQFCHINESNCYVLFLLEFPATKKTVVFVFKEREYLFFFIAIGTAALRLDDHAYNICAI